MATQHASGTQAATVTTEHTLGTDPDLTAGVFQLAVDLTNMVRGDALELRVYDKMTGTGDSQVVLKLWHFVGEQNDLGWESEAFILIHGWKMTLKQTTGTSRNFKWSQRKA